MSETRTEQDSMGSLEVPANALYGAQTQRAVENFPLSGRRMPTAFLCALLEVKAAAAQSNAQLGELPGDQAAAIVEAAEHLLARPALLATHFPVDVFQTGSGTSTNMNANEVLARLASERSTLDLHPNDHVNRGQSSNDVIPTTIHVSACLEVEHRLLPALDHLAQTLEGRAGELHHQVKTGRTHLMDAMPVRLSQVLEGWRAQILGSRERVAGATAGLHQLAQGGTAVGTGVNAHPEFAARFCRELENRCKLPFRPAANHFALMGSQDAAVALSGQLRTTAVSLMKIANDLRWMNSGPLAGLGEIELEALQPGSSIMPGKVNPVIPEAVAMVCAQVMGNDSTLGIAGQSGNFELNVMLPLVAERLLESIALLASASSLLADRAIASFTVNGDRLQAALSRNPVLVTALNPVIGYQAAARIAKQAYAEGRPIIDVAAEQTELGREELESLLDPARLADGGHDQ